jgi:hypothetical protein
MHPSIEAAISFSAIEFGPGRQRTKAEWPFVVRIVLLTSLRSVRRDYLQDLLKDAE